MHCCRHLSRLICSAIQVPVRRRPLRCVHATPPQRQTPANPPPPRLIDSVADPLYQRLHSLTRPPKGDKRALCLVEGRNAIDQVVRAGWRLRCLVQATVDAPTKRKSQEFNLYPRRTISKITERKHPPPSGDLSIDKPKQSEYPAHWFKDADDRTEVVRMPWTMFSTLASSTTPSFYLAAFHVPVHVLQALQAPYESIQPDIQRTLVLEGVQQPQNVGALIRSAVSFGYEQVICMNPSATPFSPKSMSTSAGAVANVKSLIVIAADQLFDWIDQRRAHGWQGRIVGLMPKHGRDGVEHDLGTRSADQLPHWLILGNEARGISGDLLARCTDRWTLPTTGNANAKGDNDSIDSLNVSIAGSIAMFLVHNAK